MCDARVEEYSVEEELKEDPENEIDENSLVENSVDDDDDDDDDDSYDDGDSEVTLVDIPLVNGVDTTVLADETDDVSVGDEYSELVEN